MDVLPSITLSKKKNLIKDFTTVSKSHMLIFADNKIIVIDDSTCTKLFVAKGYDSSMIAIVI